MYETMASTAQSKTHGQRLGKRREAQLASDQRTGVYARRKLRDRQRRWLASHWPLIVAAAVLSATAALFIYYFVWPPVAPYLIGGFVSSAAWWTYTVMLRTGGITPQLSGIAAEQWTADSLRPLRRSGWILVNHVMLEYVDVDHVLLGPGGFFAIETKYRSDLAEATPHIGSMIAQSRKSAAGVASRLRTHPSSVRALVVAWGPGANTELPEVVERDGVTLLSGSQLRHFLDALPAVVNSDDVLTASASLDDYVRSRDKGEAAASGGAPRTFGQLYWDATAVAASVLATLWLIATLLTVKPAFIWSIVGVSALFLLAAHVRRRPRVSLRVKATALAVMTTSAGLAVLLAAARLVLQFAG